MTDRPIRTFTMKSKDFLPLPGASPNKIVVVKRNVGTWKSNERTHEEEPRLLGNAVKSDTPPPQTKDLEEKLSTALEKLSSTMEY